MIGQGDSHNPPPPPPPPGVPSVDMLACSSFGPSSTPPPLANPADRRPCPKAPHPGQVLKCPRCESLDTKFCYYNNYSLTQPRYFCKNCKRYWTAGGALRNVPVGGGLRKNKRSKLKLAAADADAVAVAQALAGQLQYQARVPAPVARAPAETPKGHHAASISSSCSTALPSGMSANLSGFESNLYSFDASRGGVATSENGGAATAAPSSHHHPGSNFYGEARRPPQFYSSYSTSLPTSHQYSNEAASYVVNYSFLPASNDNNLHPNEGAAGPSPSSNVNRNDGANPMISSKSMASSETKEERDEATTTNPYDWQLISEGLFNGGGDGLLYMPGGSWPDFS